METTLNSLKTPFYSPPELSGDFINTLQGLGADRGLDLAEQPGGEPAATVQPPPRHLPPAVPFVTTGPAAAAAGRPANRRGSRSERRANGRRTKKSATRPKLSVRRTLTSVTCSCYG